MNKAELYLYALVAVLFLFDTYILYEFYKLKEAYDHQKFITSKLLEEYQDAFNEITKLYKRAKELNEKMEKEKK